MHGNDDNISMHSGFAKFCLNNFFIKDNLNLIELGSGNGRDAIFFAHHQLNVVAIDQSYTVIDIEKNNLNNEVKKYLHPKSLDFVNEDYSKYGDIDIFYSRFTMHAISKKDEELLLPKLFNSLKGGGLLCIEARTVKDKLYGIGKDCGSNTFLTDHKRRFIESSIFLNEVLSLGFELLYFIEQDDLSVYKDDNPVLMRIILKKK